MMNERIEIVIDGIIDYTMLFRVNDNAMSGDRLMEGDEVVIEKQPTYTPDDITLIVGDVPMLRRIKHDGSRYILSSSNPAVPDLFRDEILVIGKVTHSILKPN